MNAEPDKKVFIKTYGCQMNVYDSQRMQDVLADTGYVGTDAPDDADLIILNTCHIREKAAEKVYSELGRLRRIKAERTSSGFDMLIAVAGCVAQAPVPPTASAKSNTAKNVILFIGDGMGLTTVMASRVYKGQQEGRPGEEEVLSFEAFPNVALSKVLMSD